MNRIARIIMGAAAAMAFVAPALAQGPPGGGPGGFNPPPEMMAKIKAWQKWRENHKSVAAITHTIRGLGECEKDPKTALNKDQAKKVLAVLKAWRTKPVMSNDQAGGVNKALNAPLSLLQIKKIAATPEFGQRGGGGGGGMGRPGGGGGGPGGGRPGGPGGFTLPDPKDFNPLNPDSSPFQGRMKDMAVQRYNELLKSLEAAK